jgi:hypothetical protein
MIRQEEFACQYKVGRGRPINNLIAGGKKHGMAAAKRPVRVPPGGANPRKRCAFSLKTFGLGIATRILEEGSL